MIKGHTQRTFLSHWTVVLIQCTNYLCIKSIQIQSRIYTLHNANCVHNQWLKPKIATSVYQYNYSNLSSVSHALKLKSYRPCTLPFQIKSTTMHLFLHGLDILVQYWLLYYLYTQIVLINIINGVITITV